MKRIILLLSIIFLMSYVSAECSVPICDNVTCIYQCYSNSTNSTLENVPTEVHLNSSTSKEVSINDNLSYSNSTNEEQIANLSEQILSLNKKVAEQETLLQKIVNFLKRMFGFG